VYGSKVLKAGFLLLLFFLFGFHYGLDWWQVGRFIATTDDAYIGCDISVVSAKVEGYVVKVLVTENQPVRAGETLISIEDLDLVARRRQTSAQVAAKKAALLSAEANINRQRSLVAEAEASVAMAESEEQRAHRDLRRYQDLARVKGVSEQDLETAIAAAQKSSAARQKARAGSAAAEAQATVAAASRDEAEAMLHIAEAALEAADVEVSRTIIKAPIGGTVGNRIVQLGQLVKPGTQLLSIVPTRSAYVVANFKETQLAHMRVGQKASIQIDAFPSLEIGGEVESFSPATGSVFSLLPPENATGNFFKIVQRLPVRISLDDQNPLATQLRSGLSVEVSVDTRNRGGTASSTDKTVVGRAQSGPQLGGQ
jgi:membrane fusion protein (multidrug efflux system)